MIRFKCGQCGKSLKASVSTAGRRAKCSGCKAIVRVPVWCEVSESISSEHPNHSSTTKNVQCDNSQKFSFNCQCGKVIKTDSSNAGRKAKCKQCGCVLLVPSLGPHANSDRMGSWAVTPNQGVGKTQSGDGGGVFAKLGEDSPPNSARIEPDDKFRQGLNRALVLLTDSIHKFYRWERTEATHRQKSLIGGSLIIVALFAMSAGLSLVGFLILATGILFLVRAHLLFQAAQTGTNSKSNIGDHLAKTGRPMSAMDQFSRSQPRAHKTQVENAALGMIVFLFSTFFLCCGCPMVFLDSIGGSSTTSTRSSPRSSIVFDDEPTIDDIHYEQFRRDMVREGLDPDMQSENEVRVFNKILRDAGEW